MAKKYRKSELEGLFETHRLLYWQKINIVVDQHGYTMLMCVVCDGCAATVKTLIERAQGQHRQPRQE
jgi:hypothetical protein